MRGAPVAHAELDSVGVIGALKKAKEDFRTPNASRHTGLFSRSVWSAKVLFRFFKCPVSPTNR
jgi:hypothetical protein